MDEVENPDLPAAGEKSPTLRPVDEDDNEDSGVELCSPTKSGIDTVEADGILNDTTKPPLSPSRAKLPARPLLKRETSAPPPQQAPPAPPEANDFSQEPPDSLTLAELKRIRSTFPNAQVPQKQQLLDYGQVYDFEYQDAQSLPVELEEWFSYSEKEQLRLRRCKVAFNEDWRKSEDGGSDWLDVSEEVRRSFVRGKVEQLQQEDHHSDKTKALMVLTYLGLGVWEETAGRIDHARLGELFPQDMRPGSRLANYAHSALQVEWIGAMADTMRVCDGPKAVYTVLRQIMDQDFQNASLPQPSRNEARPRRPDERIELWCCLTLMYTFIEVARVTQNANGRALKMDIIALEPDLLTYLTLTVSKMRWDETAPIPLTKMLLLSWKTILVTLGGIKDVEAVKKSLRGEQTELDDRGQPVITASPLDYHLFRQEISSKYPAYNPPPALFPIEPENNSILPPLLHRRPSYASGATSLATASNAATSSIMHQPVHIATPAPSPPPSPAGPGKAGKKQNYQTNQLFPFLYPPLDSRSNDLGGKGSTELQDVLVGRKWEGADIPTSILEASELFAKRMRATRAMQQTWEARVEYMKFERGWKQSNDDLADVDDFELVSTPAKEESAEQGEPLSETDEQRKLRTVDRFYRESLPQLQSFVVVLLGELDEYATLAISKSSAQNGLQAGIQFTDPGNVSARAVENGTGPSLDGASDDVGGLDKLRSYEIATKALTGTLLLLLKWLKVNHVLQYEYMTQLLLDSKYLELVIKIWQGQDISHSCHYSLDREELNFFTFCRENSRQGLQEKDSTNGQVREDSEDDAVPPPIKLKHDSSAEDAISPTSSPPDFNHPPEVDELGYPQTPLPPSPLKTYSWRNIFTTINLLRLAQKTSRLKSHRALLMVQAKAINYLKKSLKIPIALVRLYTLKLYKSQVPYCGRKWRQGNMKLITAIWLSVPAELRDDWLAGGGGGMGSAGLGDLEGTVAEAVPLEQSLRALTHWWNVRNYPDEMGVERGKLDEEMEFFTRELEKIAGPVDGEQGEESEGQGEDAGPSVPYQAY